MYQIDYVPIMRNSQTSLIPLIESLTISNGILVEIGSYAGESITAFAQSGKFEKLYAVDPWVNFYSKGDWASDGCDMNLVELAFDNRVKNFPNIIKYKMTSFDANNLFEDESIDMVYIDGNHEYSAVKQDILLWGKKVKKVGVISGHDYGTTLEYMLHVKRAVDETLGNPDFIFPDYSWVKLKCN